MDRIIYASTLLFNQTHEMVALVKKKEPAHFAYKYNSIIGRVQDGESTYDAACRVFKGETTVAFTDWQETVVLTCPHIRIHFYRGFCQKSIWELTQQRDEEIHRVPARRINEHDLVGNLRWIIPLCLDEHIRLPIEVYDPVMEESKVHPNQGS